jgi:CHAT domain-containing protein
MRVLLLLAGWLAAPLCAAAQGVAVTRGNEPLDLVGAEETAQLRRILAAPAPASTNKDVLRRDLIARIDAALRLGDLAAYKAQLQEAIKLVADEPRWHNELGFVLRDEGRWLESRQQFEAAMQRAGSAALRLFYEANLVGLLVAQHSGEAANRLAQVRQAASSRLPGTPASIDRVHLLRALGALARSDAVLLYRRGRYADELASGMEAERYYREAIGLAEKLNDETQRRLATRNYADVQRERANALRRLGRINDAEALLIEHMQLLRKEKLPAGLAAGALHGMASIRLWQREYAEAERQVRLSLRVLDRLRFEKTAPSRIEKIGMLTLLLWAQGRHADALRELTLLDTQVVNDRVATTRAQFRFERGLVYLNNRREADAVRLFRELAASNRRSLGAGHFYVAQAAGLEGVALWQLGDAKSREQAAELLKQAVLDYQSPRNADFLDDSGVRKPVRDLILATYVDAMARRGGQPAVLALGAADSLRGGVTHQAMTDAAIRATANDPALAELVRKEQDARNEQRAIQEALARTEQPDALPLEEAERLRKRSLEIESQRQQLREKIRERFPGYDLLVRAPVPSAADVAQRLGKGEAFVVLLPTEAALLVWAITADEFPTFARVETTSAQLRELVTRLRRTLDFAQMTGGRVSPFDAAAARELYKQTLAPVAGRLAGHPHLIVAASGPLATVPFATLQTGAGKRPSDKNEGDASWLVRQFSVTQVPSVAAWLALRSLPRSYPAPEPLMAWGDPVFARTAVVAAKSGATGRREVDVSRGAPATSGAAAAASALQYEQLPPLPETRDELLAIATALKANTERDVLLGVQATRDSVLAANRSGVLGRKRVLVFATHGLMAGDLPGLEQPALAMAANRPTQDVLAQLLSLDDVMGLKLNADWVVLSACNTAAEDGRIEEALSGLARGFFYAGARSLLVTQWSVETKSATLITTGTFEFHAANPTASKAESLRQAMLEVMANPRYAHPAFWAPYTLVGDGAR